jgi:hypothetical protein
MVQFHGERASESDVVAESLDDDAARAASRILHIVLGLVDTKGAWGSREAATRTIGSLILDRTVSKGECKAENRSYLVISADFPYKRGERLVDVYSLFCGGFDKFTIEVFSEVPALCKGIDQFHIPCIILERSLTVHPNLPFVFQIALVGNNNHGESILVFYTKDLLVEGADFLERVPRGDGVDEKESFACAHVLFAHSTIRQKSASRV